MSIITLSLSIFSNLVATTLFLGGGEGGEGGVGEYTTPSVNISKRFPTHQKMGKLDKNFKNKGLEMFLVLYCRTRCS